MFALGLPISQGALSTILGVLGLYLSPSYIFVTFFKMVFLVIVLGALHGLLLLPVLLSLFGPGSCEGKLDKPPTRAEDAIKLDKSSSLAPYDADTTTDGASAAFRLSGGHKLPRHDVPDAAANEPAEHHQMSAFDLCRRSTWEPPRSELRIPRPLTKASSSPLSGNIAALDGHDLDDGRPIKGGSENGGYVDPD